MPAVLKILIVFAGMLAVTRVKIPLCIALVLGGVGLCLWAGLPVLLTLGHLGSAVVAGDLWLLLAVTVLIIEIGRHITQPGNADELTAAVHRWGGRHGRAASLIALPAVIGLVPMPAGALFSAPFVERAGAGIDPRSEWQSAVNYWFRHVWEYWWPLYPGVIVTLSLFDMDVRTFIAAQSPYTLVTLVAGYVFLIRRHAPAMQGAVPGAVGNPRRAFMTILPLLVVIGSLFVFTPLLDALMPAVSAQMRKMWTVLLGLVFATAVIFIDEYTERRAAGGAAGKRTRLFSAVLSGRSLTVLFTLTGIMIFKFMLEASALLPLASEELVASGIPVAVAVAGLPFLAGMVTGTAVGFSGVSFPLVVGLLGAEASGLTPLATLVLAYGFGYMGMMLSPVHLCLLVTRDYFNASIPAIFRLIAPCALVVSLYSLAAYAVLSFLGW